MTVRRDRVLLQQASGSSRVPGIALGRRAHWRGNSPRLRYAPLSSGGVSQCTYKICLQRHINHLQKAFTWTEVDAALPIKNPLRGFVSRVAQVSRWVLSVQQGRYIVDDGY